MGHFREGEGERATTEARERSGAVLEDVLENSSSFRINKLERYGRSYRHMCTLSALPASRITNYKIYVFGLRKIDCHVDRQQRGRQS